MAILQPKTPKKRPVKRATTRNLHARPAKRPRPCLLAHNRVSARKSSRAPGGFSASCRGKVGTSSGECSRSIRRNERPSTRFFRMTGCATFKRASRRGRAKSSMLLITRTSLSLRHTVPPWPAKEPRPNNSPFLYQFLVHVCIISLQLRGYMSLHLVDLFSSLRFRFPFQFVGAFAFSRVFQLSPIAILLRLPYSFARINLR